VDTNKGDGQMDPSVTLHELREMVTQALSARDFLGGEPGPVERRLHELAAKFDELDGWMTRGGHTPDAWRETEDHR
jgi:hypothetical protein